PRGLFVRWPVRASAVGHRSTALGTLPACHPPRPSRVEARLDTDLAPLLRLGWRRRFRSQRGGVRGHAWARLRTRLRASLEAGGLVPLGEPGTRRSAHRAHGRRARRGDAELRRRRSRSDVVGGPYRARASTLFHGSAEDGGESAHPLVERASAFLP